MKTLYVTACLLLLTAAPAGAADAWKCPVGDPLLATGCVGLSHYTLAMQALDRGFKLLRAGDPAYQAEMTKAAEEMGFVGTSLSQYAAELTLLQKMAANKP